MGALLDLLWGPRVAAALTGDYVSPNLAELRFRLLHRPKAFVLDLGPMCSANLRVLLEAGCQVHCEHPTEPLAELAAAPADPAAVVQRYRFPHEFFDAVLLWDLYDFLPAPAVVRFSAVLRAALVRGGLIHALLRPAGGAAQAQPHRFTLQPEPSRFSSTALDPTLKHYSHRELRPLFPGLLLRRRTHQPDGLRDLLLSR